jgi:hypothetical protein
MLVQPHWKNGDGYILDCVAAHEEQPVPSYSHVNITYSLKITLELYSFIYIP